VILSKVPGGFPVSRDGAGVQFYIGTVIELFRKICKNKNFVVEMSDHGEFPKQ
jgi:hypothetical protein